MRSILSSRIVAAGAIALGLLGAASVAQARTDVQLSIGLPGFGVPVYAAPQPVYVQPEPVYVQPQPVYVAPAPVYVRPAPVYWEREHWRREEWRREEWRRRQWREHEWEREHGRYRY